ncbi:TatD family hydrolase [Tessaracoccus sp. Y36]
MTVLVDSHCHLAAYEDPKVIMNDATLHDIRIIAVTEDPEEYRRLKTRVGRSSRVEVALGLHPGGRAIRDPNQLARFFRMLPDTSWVGEIGLDYRADTGQREKKSQIAILESILGHAQISSKILSIHSRGSAPEVVQCLSQVQSHPVMHWYTGSSRLVDTAVSAGAYFSINPAMVVAERGQALLRALPRERILLETDGPYSRVRGRAAKPSDVRSVVIPALAKLWNQSVDEVEHVISKNLDELLASASSKAI